MGLIVIDVVINLAGQLEFNNNFFIHLISVDLYI